MGSNGGDGGVLSSSSSVGSGGGGGGGLSFPQELVLSHELVPLDDHELVFHHEDVPLPHELVELVLTISWWCTWTWIWTRVLIAFFSITH